jgi:MYXO-CTERM domain-containing protein
VCDDGNQCTQERCEAGECVRQDLAGACDDGNACTADDSCVDRTCVGRDVDCEDGNPCTVGACDEATGCSQTPIPNCCPSDAACGEGEGCFDDGCSPVLCAACETDADCGAGANRCVMFPSGQRCAVACEGQGAPCPDGTVCRPVNDTWQCLPESGDCECVPHAYFGCDEGNSVWFTSCFAVDEVREDCAGRGCAHGDCCPAGTHEERGDCLPNLDAAVPPPDAAVEPDMAVEPADAAVEADMGGNPPDAGADAGVPDASLVPDVGLVPDAGGADMGPVARDGAVPDAAPLPEDGSVTPDAALPRDAGGGSDARPLADADSPDAGDPSVAGTAGCDCDTTGGGPAPALVLLALLGLVRRRRA